MSKKKAIDISTPTRASARLVNKGKKNETILPRIAEEPAVVAEAAAVVTVPTATAATTTATTTNTAVTASTPLPPDDDHSMQSPPPLRKQSSISMSPEAYDIVTGFRLYRKIVDAQTAANNNTTSKPNTSDDTNNPIININDTTNSQPTTSSDETNHPTNDEGTVVDGNHCHDDDDDDDDDNDNDDDGDDDANTNGLDTTRNTFDLVCDEEEEDAFFASASFRNTVELLEGGLAPLHPDPPGAELSLEDLKDPPPPMPNLEGLSDEEKKSHMSCWQVEMKKYRDRKNQERMDANNAVLAPNDEDDVSQFSGDQTPTLRVMEVVESKRLKKGHTFQQRDVLRLAPTSCRGSESLYDWYHHQAQ
jgi:hypothetical protein